MQFPPFPRYLVPPRSKYSPQHHVLKHPQLPFLPQCQWPSFTPIQNNRQNYSSTYLCLRWRFWSQAEGLYLSCQRLGPRLPWTKYVRDKLGWLAVRVPSPDWLCRKLEECGVCQALSWCRRVWRRGVRAVPRLCIGYPGVCLTTEGESPKNLSQGADTILLFPALHLTQTSHDIQLQDGIQYR